MRATREYVAQYALVVGSVHSIRAFAYEQNGYHLIGQEFVKVDPTEPHPERLNISADMINNMPKLELEGFGLTGEIATKGAGYVKYNDVGVYRKKKSRVHHSYKDGVGVLSKSERRHVGLELRRQNSNRPRLKLEKSKPPKSPDERRQAPEPTPESPERKRHVVANLLSRELKDTEKIKQARKEQARKPK